jgi:putative hydrolase of HD superfamily
MIHADISTWEEIEYGMSFMMDKHVIFDDTLTSLKNQIEAEAESKMEAAGIDTAAVKRRIGK